MDELHVEILNEMSSCVAVLLNLVPEFFAW